MHDLAFTSSTTDLSQAYQAVFNTDLVLLSYLIAALSAYMALNVGDRIGQKSHLNDAVWLTLGSLMLGSGIWAMHFIGMLAYELPVAVSYDVTFTLLSIIPAILASSVIFAYFRKRSRSAARLLTGGVILGLGIGTMHYMGMAAMRAPAMMLYDPVLFTVSVLVAVVLAVISLSIALRRFDPRSRNKQRLVSALIMGLAIAGMHYTAMFAVHFIPIENMDIAAAHSENRHFLALVIAALIGALLTIGLIATFAEKQMLIVSRLRSEIAQRRLLQRQLKRSEAYMRTVLATAAEGIITVDEQGIVRMINPAAERIFGYPASEIEGQNVSLLMPEPYRSNHDGYLRNYLSTGEAKIIGIGREVEGRRKDGTLFPMDLSVGEHSIDDRIFVGVLRDITARKEAEKSLLLAKATAEEANRSKATFLANMSHELKTPLHQILGYSELLIDEAGNLSAEELKTDLGRIVESSRRLSSLINAILDLSSIRSDRLELEIAPFSVAEVVESATLMLQPTAKKNGTSIHTSLADGIGSMTSDRSKVYQVLLALLDNAVKFTQGGRVDIDVCNETHLGEASVLFRISDTGIGIPDDQLTRVFDPFVQLDDSSIRRYEGAGLGLALSQQFCRLMGGEIGLSSQAGHGTVATVRLPVSLTVPRHIGSGEMIL